MRPVLSYSILIASGIEEYEASVSSVTEDLQFCSRFFIENKVQLLNQNDCPPMEAEWDSYEVHTHPHWRFSVATFTV